MPLTYSAEVSIDVSLVEVEVTLPVYGSESPVITTGNNSVITTLEFETTGKKIQPAVDGYKSFTLDMNLTPYDAVSRQFSLNVLPVIQAPFKFSVNTENLSYSSYNYANYNTLKYQGVEKVFAGDIVSTSSLGIANFGLSDLGYSVGDFVPNSPSRFSWVPTATPSDGSQVKRIDGTLVSSPVATVVSSANNQYTLPTVSGGNYDFEVSWGDGTTSNIDSWDHSDVVHTYSSPGIYEISITGTFEGVMFARHGDDFVGGTGNVDARKLLDVTKLSNLGWNAEINLDQGLYETFKWFKNNINDIRQ